MKRMIPLFLGVVFMFFGSVAESAEWKQFYQNGKSTKFLIDISGIVRSMNGNVRAWQKVVFPNGRGGDLTLFEFNCKERTYTVLDMGLWGENVLGEDTQTSTTSIKLMELEKATWQDSSQKQVWNYLTTGDEDEVRYKAWCVNIYKPKAESQESLESGSIHVYSDAEVATDTITLAQINDRRAPIATKPNINTDVDKQELEGEIIKNAMENDPNDRLDSTRAQAIVDVANLGIPADKTFAGPVDGKKHPSRFSVSDYVGKRVGCACALFYSCYSKLSKDQLTDEKYGYVNSCEN